MSEETENVPKVEPEAEKMETETPAVVEEKMEVKEEVKDLVPEMYRLHGGDPRELNLNCAVMVSGIPSDFINDSYEQFDETMRTMLGSSHSLKSDVISKIIRIPVIDETAPNKSNALRALICFSDKMQQCRCLARKKNFEDDGQRVEALEALPEALLFLSDEDRQILEEGVHERENDGEDEDGEEVDELELEEDDEDGDGHDEHEEDSDGENEEKDSKEEVKKEATDDAKAAEKKAEAKKPEPPKKKVYEDEDEKAPFEMKWEGAPEFQWRLCEGNRDEKKLIIENLMWSDMNDVFIYRTIQKATNCEVNFPARFAGEGNRPGYGRLTLTFPGFVAIMDEALKHLIYFRSGDNRRIKVFLPQTTNSLKRKEEFEGKLGRLIKPTPRMMELVIKILPNGYTPSLDDACEWFPDQSVIGCEMVMDEMGKPCAVVKFETAQEAIAAHASRSFVLIRQKVEKKETEAAEVVKKEDTTEETKKEEEPEKEKKKEESKDKVTRCNVFMRGVEAHFGSLITFYDQRRKAQEQQRQNRQRRQSTSNTAPKRPAGSTIRGPAQKKRAPSPKRGGAPNAPSASTPRGGGAARSSRGGGAATSSGGRRSSPSRSASRPVQGRGSSSTRGGAGGSRGGSGRGTGPSPRGGGRSGGDRGGMSRSGGSNQRQSNSYRNEAFSGSSRGPQRADAFSGYGYANFDRQYSGGGGGHNDRPAVDPFGRPMCSVPAFSSSTSHHQSSYRDDRGSGGGHGFSSSSFDNRRRY